MRSLEGEFSAAVTELQHALTKLRVRIEAWLDFPDEELPFDAAPECAAELDALVAKLDELATRARSGRALRDGLSVDDRGPAERRQVEPAESPRGLRRRDRHGDSRHDARSAARAPHARRLARHRRRHRRACATRTIPIEREGVRRARLEVARADRLLWVADAREPLAARSRRRAPRTAATRR